MNRLTIVLGAAVLVLAGALLFLLGRPSGAPVEDAPAVESTSGRSPGARPSAAIDASPSAQDASGAPHIPPQFQGGWAPDRLSCTARGGSARIDIGAGEVAFHESAGRPTQIVPLSGGRVYAITLAMAGEGQTWSRTIHLRRVGHELAVRDAEETGEQLYIRC